MKNLRIVEDIKLLRESARVGKFRTIPTRIYVSIRRFNKYGMINSLWVYAKLTYYLIFDDYASCNKVSYPLGKFI